MLKSKYFCVTVLLSSVGCCILGAFQLMLEAVLSTMAKRPAWSGLLSPQALAQWVVCLGTGQSEAMFYSSYP